MADVLTHPESTAARVGRAFERGQVFTFERYLGLTDRFLDATMEAFHAHEPTASGGQAFGQERGNDA